MRLLAAGPDLGLQIGLDKEDYDNLPLLPHHKEWFCH